MLRVRYHDFFNQRAEKFMVKRSGIEKFRVEIVSNLLWKEHFHPGIFNPPIEKFMVKKFVVEKSEFEKSEE